MGYILTGSIATGKSSVARQLQKLGFEVIDADKIAKELIDPFKIEQLFGKEYIKDGEVDRKKLGALIFKNRDKKRLLESYLHPLIREEISKRVERLKEEDREFVVDIPLFFESGDGYDKEGGVIVVYAPKKIQLKRLMNRDSLSLEEAKKRIESQMDIDRKKQMADFVIDNSKDLKHLKNEVERFYASIKI